MLLVFKGQELLIALGHLNELVKIQECHMLRLSA